MGAHRLSGSGRHWQTLADTSRYWQTLADSGNAGRHCPDTGIHWQTHWPDTDRHNQMRRRQYTGERRRRARSTVSGWGTPGDTPFDVIPICIRLLSKFHRARCAFLLLFFLFLFSFLFPFLFCFFFFFFFFFFFVPFCFFSRFFFCFVSPLPSWDGATLPAIVPLPYIYIPLL